ncbi:MAG: metallophosphoesterase family protein [Flavobacteriales bacterium]
MKRTLAIGDIHGGLKALVQVLERAEVTAEDTLIFLGDYVDGWSESAQVIEFLIELDKKQECVFILGNHDLWCKLWIEKGASNPIWLAHGGKETVESYIETGYMTSLEHKNFFNNLKNYYIDDENRLFLHAGFTSMHGVLKEEYESNFYFDRTLWEMALTMDKRIKKDSELYPSRLNHYKDIYIGHTPTTNYSQSEPMNAENVWNIDTGAAFKGKLTCMDIDTKQFWQSDELPSLYPDEKGRN